MCQFLIRIAADDLVPIADLPDGTPVYENSHIGGLADLMVTFEEWLAPIFTAAAPGPAERSPVELAMVCSCVSVAGLGATVTHSLATVEPGSVVAVVGCGPLGLSAVQGARIAGAARIIAATALPSPGGRICHRGCFFISRWEDESRVLRLASARKTTSRRIRKQSAIQQQRPR
jgi:hypothetical protein